MDSLLCKNNIAQKNLEQRLVASISRSVQKYFEAGGDGLSRVNLHDIFKEGLKQGAISFSGDNIELAAAKLGSSPGYMKSVNYLKVNAEKRESAKKSRVEILDKNIFKKGN